MTTNRLYAVLFGAPVVLSLAMMAAVSGGDLAFVAFGLGPVLLGIGLVALFAIPLTRRINRWQRAPLDALARRVGGTVRASIGADAWLEVDGLLVFWIRTPDPDDAEAAGAPWTCVGRLRDGPVCAWRLRPDGRALVHGRRLRPGPSREDPARTPEARAALDALAAIEPRHETLVRWDGRTVAFAVPGWRRDPEELERLVRVAGPAVRAL